MKIVSDVLLLSYLDKFGLSVTVEAGQALAVLYSGARLMTVPMMEIFWTTLDTDTNEVAKLRMVPSILIIFAV
jgi:hypothetical protein